MTDPINHPPRRIPRHTKAHRNRFFFDRLEAFLKHGDEPETALKRAVIQYADACFTIDHDSRRVPLPVAGSGPDASGGATERDDQPERSGATGPRAVSDR